MGVFAKSLLFLLLHTVFVSACSVDENCSLNGLCQAGKCVCDKPWGGESCGELQFLPAPVIPSYGCNSNVHNNSNCNESAWGGNVIKANGKYHLYVANMDGLLSTWASKSYVDHAVSDTIEGPYQKVSTVIPKWSHNPQAIRATVDGKDKYYIFHIGSGGIHSSDAPEGPFERLNVSFSCNNPSPYVSKNGTWYCLCSDRALITASSPEGPWHHFASIHSGSTIGTPEDPYLFVDKRNNWHAFFHVWSRNQFSPCNNCSISAHYFSRDGLTWQTLPTYVQPYRNTIKFADGTSRVFATLERPKLFFNEEGVPTHLFNAASNSYTCKGWCSSCKQYDYTANRVRPLDV